MDQPVVVETLRPEERKRLSARHPAARAPEAYLVGTDEPGAGELLRAIAELPATIRRDLVTALGAERGRHLASRRVIEALGRPPDDGATRDRTTQAAWNAELRSRFLDEVESLTAVELARRAHSRSSNPSALAYRWRTQGLIFGVPVRGEWRYPAFQLEPDTGRPRPIIAQVLRLLAGRLGNWGTALWFAGPNGWLDGARPADRLGDEPALLRAASAAIEGGEF